VVTALEWNLINADILSALDLRAEYTALGVDVTGSQPNEAGWIECRAHGTEDRHPSAGINIAGKPPLLGRYREFTGQGRSVSFWDFAAEIHGKTWKECRAKYAKQTKIKLPKGGGPKLPADQLEFKPWNQDLVASWCRRKGGISPHAVKASGCRRARWHGHNVLAWPLYGEHLLNDDPVGWTILNITGDMLPVGQGKGQSPRMVKMLTVAGSKMGWMNEWALRHLGTAEMICKVEGLSDMLTLQTMIPPEKIKTDLIVSNSGGTLETPSPEKIAIFTGKQVIVVHDNDEPGQLGGQRWAEAIALVAKKVIHLTLPGEVTKDHGRDLRDVLLEE
jgi:hypothetical protein